MIRTTRPLGFLAVGIVAAVVACAAPPPSGVSPSAEVEIQRSALKTAVTVTVLDTSGVAQTGATVYAEGPHRASRPLNAGEAPRMEASNDMDFSPDHAMADGEVVSGDGFALECVTTPGHTANHMAFALKGSDILFSGDHVMGWSTTIVAPPDGAMTDYMDSLAKLSRRKEKIYLPGHGGLIREAPRFVAGLTLHRKAREASILHRLGKGATDIATLVRAIYIGLDPRLTNAAGFSVLAHMEDLVARGAVATDGPPSINGVYRLART